MYGVKVCGGGWSIGGDEVVGEVGVKVGVDGLYWGMDCGYCSEGGGSWVKSGEIEGGVGRFVRMRFCVGWSGYLEKGEIWIGVFGVGNEVIWRKDRG